MGAPAGKPNIVVFFTDQQRWDTCGCYGQELPVTSNLDKLAAGGVRFEYAFTCQPVCGPARAAVQTGLYPTATGCFRNDIALGTHQKTIAHFLSDAGYDCGYVGKWHLASTGPDQVYHTAPVPPELRGGYRDYWMAADVLEFTSHGYGGYVFNADMERVDFTGYRADAITDFALDFLTTRTGEKPFFLFASYIEPHHQNDRNRFEGPDGSKERFARFEAPPDLEGGKGDWEENYADYLGCCASLDANLGRIQARLHELGLTDNTLILFTSDHGCHFRTRNAEYKRSCHEASIRVPMVMAGPGVPRGRIVSELASLIDLAPTVLKAAGLEPPPYMHGRPLQQLTAEGGCSDWPEDVFIQISESAIARAVRTADWKYSVWVPGGAWSGSTHPGSDTYVEECLYDLREDPHEKENLVTSPGHNRVRAKLAAVLTRRMVEAGEAAPLILPAGAPCA